MSRHTQLCTVSVTLHLNTLSASGLERGDTRSLEVCFSSSSVSTTPTLDCHTGCQPPVEVEEPQLISCEGRELVTT